MHMMITILTMALGGNSATSNLLYLDPGSGSILLQLLIASGLGALFVIRSSWGKIKAFFNKSTEEDITQDNLDE
jgi:hypothetical protein